MDFQESDIIFSDDLSSDQTNTIEYYSVSMSNRHGNRVVKKKVQERSSSVPLNIPGSSSSSSSPSSSFRYEIDHFGDDFYNENDEIVPPHVIVDRRCASFNMNGKKRKNLIHFRNSILKLTGFLES
ncbi:hypothetical protein RND81_06G097600 [Saponaria officinalis]|uniref:Uncharacterized protein n=1 Tax=Saponaria officinalis TaxID=3572 RepID=A0AAW1K9C2_SAPOF